ncbi:hypothetical protein OPV22_019932 [Ensete ventricosum]|uniref:Uncharacterized protein n=1 Tax=Ensete ventricosum TaxID=4639 RepID=A0AAV8QF64_ENSVE|nr:hypothetical protein OPV22_019932 [Ensete ventricosum]
MSGPAAVHRVAAPPLHKLPARLRFLDCARERGEQQAAIFRRFCSRFRRGILSASYIILKNFTPQAVNITTEAEIIFS